MSYRLDTVTYAAVACVMPPTATINISFQSVGTPTPQTPEDFTIPAVAFDITNRYQEQIVPGSINFTLGGKRYFDRLGTLYNDLDVATGEATSAGTINYLTGEVVLSNWAAGQANTLAMFPPPGTSAHPIPVPETPCYLPVLADQVQLLFQARWSRSTTLVFRCETCPAPDASVVVPVRRVYVVLNQASLKRVEGNIPLPTLAMSLSIDVDSWTWSFSASLPGSALSSLTPSAPGVPVLVEAVINGVAYRMLIEKRGRDRSFGANALKISGRGCSAVLDAPYASSLSYTNTTPRTAQQLMNDVLTMNGVGIGWEIDYQAVDWSIPAGVFVQQGSYMAALNVIAEAAGSYIQTDRLQQLLHILPRYPVMPWSWESVTPDIEIPSDLATVEGIEWIDKALYNRIFVSGTANGVLGQVTRAGSDGGLVAPMITDALITTAAAARQRGARVLADTGSQALVTLRLPVLAETGIISPGKFVRYVDGGNTHLGISRSVQIEVGSPETWQTIVLETHV